MSGLERNHSATSSVVVGLLLLISGVETGSAASLASGSDDPVDGNEFERKKRTHKLS